MTIQDWGAVGEVVGSLAVLITLIYLSIQVRQNTRHVRAQMSHDGWLANSSDEYAKMSSDVAGALARVDLGMPPPTAADLKIFDALLRGCVLHMGRVEHMNGQDLQIYSVEETALAYIDQFNSPGGRVWWKSNQRLIETLCPNVGTRVGEMLAEPGCPSRAEAFVDFCQEMGAGDAEAGDGSARQGGDR